MAGGTGSAERHGEGLHRTAARGARGLALTEGGEKPSVPLDNRPSLVICIIQLHTSINSFNSI